MSLISFWSCLVVIHQFRTMYCFYRHDWTEFAELFLPRIMFYWRNFWNLRIETFKNILSSLRPFYFDIPLLWFDSIDAFFETSFIISNAVFQQKLNFMFFRRSKIVRTNYVKVNLLRIVVDKHEGRKMWCSW